MRANVKQTGNRFGRERWAVHRSRRDSGCCNCLCLIRGASARMIHAAAFLAMCSAAMISSRVARMTSF